MFIIYKKWSDLDFSPFSSFTSMIQHWIRLTSENLTHERLISFWDTFEFEHIEADFVHELRVSLKIKSFSDLEAYWIDKFLKLDFWSWFLWIDLCRILFSKWVKNDLLEKITLDLKTYIEINWYKG